MMQLIKPIPSFPVRKIDKAVKFFNARFRFECRHQDELLQYYLGVV